MNHRTALARASIAAGLLIAGLSSAQPNSAQGPTTWVVGPGGDFPQIQQAINAASDGDTILIKVKNQFTPYGSFQLDKSLSLVGESGLVAGDALIEDTSGLASLADMELSSAMVIDCTEAVVFDTVLINGSTGQYPFPAMHVDGSADVRLIETTLRGISGSFETDPGGCGLYAVDSRVEIIGGLAKGGNGAEAYCEDIGGSGGHGALVSGTSKVHASVAKLRGGKGGEYNIGGLCSTGYAGWGGDGAHAGSSNAQLIVTGGEASGGKGGKGAGAMTCGDGGDGIGGTSSATLRHSGAELYRGVAGGFGCSSGKAISISKVQAVPDDPTLARLATPVTGPGGSVTLVITGNPGAYTRLFLGSQPAVLPKPNTFLELLLLKESTVALGAIPASGQLTYQLDLDPATTGYAPGMAIYAQAVSNYPGGEQRRTNSVPLILR